MGGVWWKFFSGYFWLSSWCCCSGFSACDQDWRVLLKFAGDDLDWLWEFQRSTTQISVNDSNDLFLGSLSIFREVCVRGQKNYPHLIGWWIIKKSSSFYVTKNKFYCESVKLLTHTPSRKWCTMGQRIFFDDKWLKARLLFILFQACVCSENNVVSIGFCCTMGFWHKVFMNENSTVCSIFIQDAWTSVFRDHPMRVLDVGAFASLVNPREYQVSQEFLLYAILWPTQYQHGAVLAWQWSPSNIFALMLHQCFLRSIHPKQPFVAFFPCLELKQIMPSACKIVMEILIDENINVTLKQKWSLVTSVAASATFVEGLFFQNPRFKLHYGTLGCISFNNNYYLMMMTLPINPKEIFFPHIQ